MLKLSHHTAARSGAWLLLLSAVALLSGCNARRLPTWDTQDVTGALPPLEFTLTGSTGKTVRASDYAAGVRLLYFGYTHCPDVCPTTLAVIQAALGELGPQADKVRVLFVSVDPRRDTAALLQNYAAAFGTQFVGLTGTQHQLQALTSRYHTTYSYLPADANGEYTVQHSAAVFAFDRHGKARLLMEYQKGAHAIAHDLRQLLAQE